MVPIAEDQTCLWCHPCGGGTTFNWKTGMQSKTTSSLSGLPYNGPQLVATQDNPIPDGASVLELRTRDGRHLREATFAPSGKARGTVALFQGRSEFIEKYFETIGDLLSRGFCVTTIDWRGQGGSKRELLDRRKGHIADFALYQRDIEALVQYLVDRRLPQPWLALAHSMGGAILLEHAHLHGGSSPFHGMIFSSPMIDIALPVRGIVRLLVAALNALGLGEVFIPTGKGASNLEAEFPGNKLTSDPVRFARSAAVLAKAPLLALGDPTIGWVAAALRQIRRFQEPGYTTSINTPCLFFACGDDRIVSAPSIAEFAGRIPVSRLVSVPSAQHEILIEHDQYRAQFWAAFDAFVADMAA